MGTLVQTVFETQAAEIRMLGALGCEATTLGNHEFDYRSKGLAKMLETAAESGDTVPELLVCNINWDAMEQQGFSEGQQQRSQGKISSIHHQCIRIFFFLFIDQCLNPCKPADHFLFFIYYR